MAAEKEAECFLSSAEAAGLLLSSFKFLEKSINTVRFIFDRFYKSDKSRKKKDHFGLGLSIAITLAKIQGLKLGVQDTDGGGSTFWMSYISPSCAG